MKIAIVGATGNVGTKLVTEALARGHQVTAIARNTGKLTVQKGLSVQNGDLSKPNELAKLLKGHDVILSSTPFGSTNYDQWITAIKESGVGRVLVVGGAGSLEVAPGLALIDTPEFPAIYKPEAAAGRDFLNKLRREAALEWTFLSPSAMFLPEGRTGKFRLGKDQLLVNSKGESKVTMADFAIAMIDEVEKPQHIRQRFTVVDAS